MEKKSNRKKAENCKDRKNISKDTINKETDNNCFINGEKIEGNACSTILNNK